MICSIFPSFHKSITNQCQIRASLNIVKHFPSFLNETFGLIFHEIFHEWYALDLYDHPCVISQPWQPDKDTNNTANSKLQMVIDCLDVLGDSMPLEVTFVYSPNFRKCWKCIKEYWPIDEVFPCSDSDIGQIFIVKSVKSKNSDLICH